MNRSRLLTLFFPILLFSQFLMAQGDGTRMLLWGPTGVTGFIPKWMHMEQNVLPSQYLVKDASVTINAFPMTLIHNFGIKGRFAQIMVNAVPGSVKGQLTSDKPNLPAPGFSNSGFSDGFLGFKLGLINQPALNVKEYAAYKHKTFSMMGYFRYWYSGTYDRTKAVNLGSNRPTFEIGTPMNIYLAKEGQLPVWLEIYPAVHLYGTNHEPTIITSADETKQQTLFSIENHISKNFTKKFWAGLDLRYQIGGSVKNDGVDQDNQINYLGGGATVGYKILPIADLNVNYGGQLLKNSDTKGSMLKITMQITYANLKKLE